MLKSNWSVLENVQQWQEAKQERERKAKFIAERKAFNGAFNSLGVALAQAAAIAASQGKGASCNN